MEKNISENVFGQFGDAKSLYFEGDMEAAVALSGQVAGRIQSVRPVADIIHETIQDFYATVASLSKTYPLGR